MRQLVPAVNEWAAKIRARGGCAVPRGGTYAPPPVLAGGAANPVRNAVVAAYSNREDRVMPRFKVELLRVVTDREVADVVVEAEDADGARRLALEGCEDGEIDWVGYDREDVTDAETGAVEELP
ncbi:hypothetical protein JMJ56_23140 [Belnapia sp. T18]|uniref:Uncharacterized protein n=1 Tax=Belnapia arida TaxID=2804533 RepID=A0ABS1U8A5_9PROT|nr:hypothetical protein [Belnapia arida]MBL6080913.1 hypothetical protein [Belnapia arida]